MLSLSSIAISLTLTEAFRPNGWAPTPIDKPYDQTFTEQYSPLKYMGNLGPYTSRRGNGISTDVPPGCSVDQVVLMQRHGESYPEADEVKVQKALLDKIKRAHPQSFTGDLSFLNGWTYFLDSEGDAGLEIASGPYAGLSDLYEKGALFAGRYGYLWDKHGSVPLFASKSERVLQSARQFGQGFFHYNYTDVAQLNIIDESENVGANAISPKFCQTAQKTECKVPQTTSLDGIKEIIFPEFDIAAIRLNEEYGLHLTGNDIVTLLDIASYDVSARGDSPWSGVFTLEEWNAYAYRRSLEMYCYHGEGSKIAKAIGASWANATTQLLNQGPEGSGLPLVLNFGHHTEITAFLGGIGALEPLKPLNPEQVTFDTHYDLSDIVPMGAQLVIERLKCKAPGLTNNTDLISTNASLPESYLNASYGSYDMNAHGGAATSYFSPEFTNRTINTTYTLPGNTTGISNFTSITPYKNTTITVHNISYIIPNVTIVHQNGSTSLVNKTASILNVKNSTTYYGFNMTSGVTNDNPVEDSLFVRVLLNDAVVPLDFCYEGPGYSCSLQKWTGHIAEKVRETSYNDVCHSVENGKPSTIDFYWNYSKSNKFDTVSSIPWQGMSPA